MSLTISPSPFGSLVVSVAETGSTLSVTTVATSPAVLSMALGVPGPAGATGSQGPAGTNGTNGVGVAAGGTTGQALVKLSGTNYDTGWATITSGGGTWGSITGTLSNQTDLYDALNGKLSLTGGNLNGNLYIEYNDVSLGLTPNGLSCGGDTAGWILNGDNGLGFTDYEYTRYKGDRIIFNDQSEQTTAGLPLTGGTLSGGLTIGIGGIIIEEPNVNGNSIDIYSGGAIRFGADDSYQYTAFPGYTGTTSRFIDGTGALQTYGPLGDRYLTSSTSTLTCDSGNGKTMTVGTGLSYSRQQDITVSYSNAIHMHGTVLTYDSATGVMTFDSNTHSGSGTFSNWEVNVGGVAGSVLPVGGTSGQVLAKINSTNFNTEWISLGTMATATASDYLAKADNLSGLASTTTARTNLGLGAVSTDAYATTTQAQAGTSTTTVINPSTLRDTVFTPNISKIVTGWTSATLGTGGTNNTINDFNQLGGPISALGTYVTKYRPTNIQRGGSLSRDFDWSKRMELSFRIWLTTTTGTDPNSTGVISLGENGSSNQAGLPNVRSIGVQLNYGSNIKILAHNGTSLTTFTTSTTVASLYLSAADIVLTSDPATGTVTCFLNGTSIGSTTGGPTTDGGGFTARNNIVNKIFNSSVPSGTQLGFYVAGTTSFVGY